MDYKSPPATEVDVMHPCSTSDFGAALNEAQQQLDWGTEVGALSKAAEYLKGVDPDHRLVRQLELKIVRLKRLGDDLSPVSRTPLR